MIKINLEQNNSSILLSENQKHSKEINVTSMGYSVLAHGYDFSIDRDLYVIHFLISGKGTALGKPIEAPMGFILSPDVRQSFHVSEDTSQPKWDQFWIMIDGTNAKKYLEDAGFPTEASFFEIPYHEKLKTFFHFLFRDANYFDCDDYYYLLSKLNSLFSIHSYSSSSRSFPRKNTPTSPYVTDAISYIKEKYSQDIKLDDIADALHISSKYLYKLFKNELGTSPIKYLNSYRIICAQELIASQSLPIKTVANAVGFQDPNYFCHVFKRYSNGISPTEYKQNIR